MPEFDKLLRHIKDNKGSDLHLASGLPPRFRTRGSLDTIPGWPVLTPESLLALMREVCEPVHWQAFEETNDCDFAYAIPGVARSA